MLPSLHYQQLVEQDRIDFDQQQADLLKKLDVLYLQLTQESTRVKRFAKAIHQLLGKYDSIKGLYVWGNVGTGKSFLMDNFFNCLTVKKKIRLHYHNFMDLVHYELMQYQGKKDPLKKVAKDIVKRANILCLDELIVNDIADAMLLAELFKYLLANQVRLVFTSNTEPRRLYEKGLQRQRFIPAIKLIEQHCDVVHLSNTVDYRQRNQGHADHFLTPNNEANQQKLCEFFKEYSGSEPMGSGVISVLGRSVKFIARTENVIWFDFEAICNIPRSQKDYLAIVKKFNTVFISNVRQIAEHETNIARCFINLIDVLYDHRIRLIISSECAIDQLYPKGRLILSFVRTQSRLTEMQALDWL